MSDEKKRLRAERERLEDELELVKAMEPLEKARAAMHAKKNPHTIKAYKVACKDAVAARQAFRIKYPRKPVGQGDAVATPETVAVKVGVDRGDV